MVQLYKLFFSSLFAIALFAGGLLLSSGSVEAQTGVLDQTFGNQGKVQTTLDTGALAKAVMIQPDGKIIAAGQDWGAWIDLVRYKTDGSLDSTFGKNGKVVYKGISFSLNTAALQSTGKIVVAGQTYFNNATWFVVARFTNNGQFDSTFGTNGISYTNISNNYCYLKCLAIRPDDRIVAGGVAQINNNAQFAVMQFSANGRLDTTFGSGGMVSFPIGYRDMILGLALTPSGEIIAGGTSTYTCTTPPCSATAGFSIIKLTETGQPDTRFGVNGIRTKLFTTASSEIGSMTLQNGNIIIGANLSVPGTQVTMSIMRFDSTGAFDSTFGNNGVAAASSAFKLYSLQVQPDGKIVAAGGNTSSTVSNSGFNLARFTASGRIDTLFGRKGMVATNFSNTGTAYTSAIQPDGKIVLAGEAPTSNTLGFALARYEQNGRIYYNNISGTVFLDGNKNGIRDSLEPLFPRADVRIVRGGIDTVIVNSFGKYSLDVDTGAYTTTVMPYRSYYAAVPASYSKVYTGYFNEDTADFAMQPIAGKRDLAVTIVPIIPARPGFNNSYRIFYTNVGTDTAVNSIVDLLKDRHLTYSSSSRLPDYIAGDTIRWIINRLMPGDTGSILIYTKVAIPPIVNINDTLTNVASINSSATDLYYTDNYSLLKQRVVSSFDPNEKSESHAGEIRSSRVASGEYMQYTIRFQNTGNDTAFNVVIRDTLDPQLDWSTFQMIGTSHPFELLILDGSRCIWTFNNIKLLDSTKNVAASQGYIQFIIKPRANLNVGDIIRNKAAIYFDYNLPIITNTETTIVTYDLLPVKLLSFSAFKSGRKHLLQWTVANEAELKQYELERSSDGAEFKTLGLLAAGKTSYQYLDEKPLKGVNYYRLKMLNRDGSASYSNTRVLSFDGSFDVVIYPNPAGEKLQLLITSEKEEKLRMQITDMSGKVVLVKQLTANEGSAIRSVDLNGVQRGTYFLKIIAGSNEQMVLKFDKL